MFTETEISLNKGATHLPPLKFPTIPYSLIAINLLFILFIINIIYNIEKTIFINEIFSLFGLYFYLRNFREYIKIKNDGILLALNAFLLYCILKAAISLPTATSLYGYLRALVLWYSAFGFFLGIEFIKKYKQILAQNVLDRIGIPCFAFLVLYGNIIISPALLPFLFKRYRRISAFIFTLIGFSLLLFFSPKLTIRAMLIVFILTSLTLRNERLKRISFHPLLIVTYILLFYIIAFFVYFYFNAFYNYGYSVIPHYIRPDTTWRLMFWGYELTQQLPSHLLFGIGFGTPLFNPSNPHLWFVLYSNSESSPYFTYTLGTHNFLVDLIIRLGVLGLLPIIFIYLIIFNTVRLHPLNWLSEACFVTFILITVGALCNVVLITPLYATTFWIFLGMLYQSLKNECPHD